MRESSRKNMYVQLLGACFSIGDLNINNVLLTRSVVVARGCQSESRRSWVLEHIMLTLKAHILSTKDRPTPPSPLLMI